MFELKKRLTNWKLRATGAMNALFCHRTIYGGLALCYGAECVHTADPTLYGAVSVLYAMLALKG